MKCFILLCYLVWDKNKLTMLLISIRVRNWNDAQKGIPKVSITFYLLKAGRNRDVCFIVVNEKKAYSAEY